MSRRAVISVVVAALMAAIAVHLLRNRDELAYLGRLSATVLVLTLSCQLGTQLALNESLRLPLQAHVKTLGVWEFFLVRTGGFLAGYVVPVAGGIAVRLAYLRRRGLSYQDFARATLLTNVLALVAAAVLVAVATGVLWSVSGMPPPVVLGLATGFLIVSAAVLQLFRWLPRLSAPRLVRRWPWLSGLDAVPPSRRTVASVFVLSIVRHCFNFVTLGLLYRAFSGSPDGFLAGGLVYALTSPLRMVNITPGNLGVNEWVLASVGKALSFDVTAGLIVALVFRIVGLAAQGVGVLAAWAWLALRSDAPVLKP